MSVVTKISAQKKRVGYYNIFIDDVFYCSLSDLQLSVIKLKVGQKLSASEQEEILSESKASKTYQRALYYLQYGPRTSKQMRDYLLQKDYEPAQVEIAIEKLQRENYINDKSLAESWIENRNTMKPRSKKQLYFELLKKGIEKDTIVEVLDGQDDAAEHENMKRIIVTKRKQAKYQDNKKLTEYLLRQGFKYADIKMALEDMG